MTKNRRAITSLAQGEKLNCKRNGGIRDVYPVFKNILSPIIENLELEELQGVSGLKALRVSINMGE